jgi:hypothetical protein
MKTPIFKPLPQFAAGVLLTTALAPALLAGEPATAPDKNPKAVTIQDQWSLPGILGGGVKTTGDYTDGNLFLVVPLYSSLGHDNILGGDVLYIQPYSSWGEGGEVSASLGLGWRHLFNDQPVTAITHHDGHQAGFLEEGAFIGANLFIDMLDTEANNQFWQLGFGLEAGTRYVEARANYYLPLSDRHLAEEFRTRESFQSSRNSTSNSVTPLNDPFATGNSIQQDALFATRQTTTTTTTTIERLFQRFEDGMEGWDAEVAVLVPGLDRYFDLKVIGGYYSFDNQPFGPQTGGTGNVEGWKVGAELRPVPAIVLNATWYENERFVGDDWLFGFRMEVPFEMGDLGDGKGFWSRIGDAFRPRRRHLAERMAEPVHRQNAAIKVASETEKAEENVSTQVKRVTRVVSQSSRRLVLADDIVFVNNGSATTNGIQAGSNTGDGTAEKPVDTIQSGANLAQTKSNTSSRVWNVYTQGTAAGYAESVEATSGSVNFIGSGKLIQGVGNTTFGTGPAPLVTGGFYATNIGFFGLNGYEVTGGFQSQIENMNGVRLYNVSQFVIDSNHIHDVEVDAINIETDADVVSVGDITNNTIENAGNFGLHLDSYGTSWLDIMVAGNAFTGSVSDHVNATSHDNSTFDLLVEENTFASGQANALSIGSADLSEFYFTGGANTIDGGVDGYFFVADVGSFMDAAVFGDSISNVSDDGVEAQSNSTDDTEFATLWLTLEGNTFNGAGNNYVETNAYGFSVMDFDATANQFNSATGDAIRVTADGQSDVTFTADGNIIRDQLGSGIHVVHTTAANMDATIINNVISNSAQNGIQIESSSIYFGVGPIPTLNVTITGNQINGTLGGSALLLSTTDAGNIQGTISNNAIQNAASHGVEVLVDNFTEGTGVNVLFDSNVIRNSFNDGINLTNNSDGALNLSGSLNNTVTGSGDNTLRSTGTLTTPSGILFINGSQVNLPDSF